MPPPEIVPFADEHVDDAARLLAERHRRHREAEPLLPEAVDFRAETASLREQDEVSGAVALREGRVVAYLLGGRRDDSVWGPNVWVELAGHAAEEAEDVRDLYGFAAARWVDAGRTRHYVLVPAAAPALVDAWFRLGFGAQHALGIRELPEDVEVKPVGGVELRRAERGDVESGLAIEHVLPNHQALAPVFSGYSPPADADARAEWEETLADERLGTFLAWRDGRCVAGVVFAPVEQSSMHTGLARPESAAILGWAATSPEARGQGIGTALLNAGFAWARDEGYSTIVTDWRETNLLSSRMWPARGFQRTFLRLYRSIP